MSNPEVCLVGDVGGTNVRLALVNSASPALEAVEVRQCADFPSLQAAIEDYLSNRGVDRIHAACLAVACPVSDDHIQFTNNPWSFSRNALKASLNVQALHVVNDFEAMAMGMLSLAPHEVLPIRQATLQGQQPRVVIGPGTGLGFSVLVHLHGQWTALPTEGGHVGFTPRDELEIEILKLLLERHNGRVSAERVLCGQGLVNVYDCLATLRQQAVQCRTPAEVSAAAHAGDRLAQEALDRFCAMLGAYAGDMVLAVGAYGGVYLCGGILPRIQETLLCSRFVESFTNKGRFASLLQGVPVVLSLAEFPGLMGSAAILSQSLKHSP
ncbi:MAG: glucokinase [Limnobacter sp.]|uniref:glucokinase n=1 Tax=Limnobacter sp. TaxID=2003368 RepID=UPI00391D33BC